MVAAEILVEHVGNVHAVELLADIVGTEAVAVRIALHVKGDGRVGGAVEEAHRAGFLVPLELRVVVAGQIDCTRHGDDAGVVEAFGKSALLGGPVVRAEIVLGIHAVDGAGAAAADDDLLRIDVVLVGMLDQPERSGIDVLDADVDGELECVVAFWRGDERFAVTAAGGAEAVVDGDADPALLAKVVIQGVAEGVHPGAHGPGAAEGINEYRALAFGLLALELIDVHQDGLAVADDELHRVHVGFGHDRLLLLRHLRAGAQGQGKESRTEKQQFLHDS